MAGGGRPLAIPGTQKLIGDGGISGVAILAGIAGVVLVVSGIKNATIAEVMRAYLQGRNPQQAASLLPERRGGGGDFGRVLGGASGVSGAAVAARAQSYVGVRYVWAGHTPDGWDCSGFVTWVLHHDFGIALPDATHTVTGKFMTWGGARDVPRAQCQAGDLVCWWGHIGIAVDNANMVNAPGLGIRTRVQPIWSVPAPVIRRPLAYGAGGQ